MSRPSGLRLVLAMAIGALAIAPGVALATIAQERADVVWGQYNLRSGGFGCAGPTSHRLCNPASAVIDNQGNLWVADTGNSRVLLFRFNPAINAPATVAKKSFGQYGKLTTGGCDRQARAGSPYPVPHPASRYTLCFPSGVAVDGSGDLFVADSGNNRVLVYFDAAHKGRASPADLVLGQPDFFAGAANNVVPGSSGGPRCPSNRRPFVVQPAGKGQAHFAVKVRGLVQVGHPTNLLVAIRDRQAHTRVPGVKVVFNAREVGIHKIRTVTSNSSGYAVFKHFLPKRVGGVHIALSRYPFQPVTIVLPVQGPATRCTLGGPEQISVDPQGDLLVADSDNNRVLEWSHSMLAAFKTRCGKTCFVPASRVWGQGGDFTTAGADQWPPFHRPAGCVPEPSPAGACTLSRPADAVADPAGNLLVADSGDNRVLEIPDALGSSRQAANAVYGQAGSFTSIAANHGGIGKRALANPRGVSLDPSGNLWIADGNNRVLEFPSGSRSAALVLGQHGRFKSNGCNRGGRSGATLCLPESVRIDAAGNVVVADELNNRILEYSAH